jgi:hypothetical protein
MLVLANGTPHTPESLAIKSGIPAALIEQCLEVVQEPAIDWIDNQLSEIKKIIPQEGAGIPQEGAGIPQEGAGIPQEGAGRARAERTDGRTEGKGKEGSTTGRPTAKGNLSTNPSAARPLVNPIEYPETTNQIRLAFPETDEPFIARLVEAVQSKTTSSPPDLLIAEAVRQCWTHNSASQKKAGLFLQTVPQCVSTWINQHKAGPLLEFLEQEKRAHDEN